MDNSFFRNLVNNTPRVDRSSGSTNATSTSTAAPLLGSRQRSSIPMTPRSVGGASSFAQQAAAYRLQQNPPKEKKFRSAVPLGSKLPEGYVDRSKLRDDEDTSTTTDAEQRMAALMKLVEEGSLTREEAIEQSKAFGGDAGSTHLVKGLDFKLLERARKGEDVLAVKKQNEEALDESDIEDELDQALEKKVESVQRQKKKGEADDDDDEPKKKTRAKILAEWKKSREEAAAKKAAENSLGSKFKKFGEKQKKVKSVKEEKATKTSRDTTSGKKRKRDHEEALEKALGNGTVLGMLPPELPSTKAAPPEKTDEDEDVNIFDDAPDDYDPLAGLVGSDDSGSDGEVEEEDKSAKRKETQGDMPPPPPPPPNRPRNYFATSSKDADVSTESISSKPLSGQDLANTMELSAAIKKAAQMRELSKADLDDEEAKKAARHKAMLQAASRDDEDVDMGFGGSRTFGDDDDDDLGVTKKKKKRGKKNA